MPEHQQIQQSKKPDTTFQKQATPVVQTPASNPYSIIQRAKINPKSLTHADIMQLQRTIGNQAVGKLLSSIRSSSTAQQAPIQRPEIPAEEETCPSCMQRQEIPEEEEPLQGKMIETIQRQEIPEEEEPLQGKFENKPDQLACPSCFVASIVQRQELEEDEKPLQGKVMKTVQRQEIPEEEEPLQGKMIETIQRQEIPEEEEPLQPKRENNTGMPDNLKAGVENLSEIDMSDVRVHYNSSKPAEVGALAYTQGTNIHVATGQERHLPHETWHVVQQKYGRVRPTGEVGGMPLNDSMTLESEADIMGQKALQMYAQVEKPKENKSRMIANYIAQKQSGREQVFGFVDNRVVQRLYDSKSGIYIGKDRPSKPDELKGTDELNQKLTAHHIYPWNRIKEDLNSALQDQSKEKMQALLTHAGVTVNEDFWDDLAKKPVDRSKSFGNEVNKIAQSACWAKQNIFMGPLGETRGKDDPGEELDASYSKSGLPTPASAVGELTYKKKGGIGGRSLLATRLAAHVLDATGRKEEAYDKSKWVGEEGTIGKGKKKKTVTMKSRIGAKGGKIPITQDKVTVAMVDDAIKTKNHALLEIWFYSPQFPLEKWEMEAWSKFLDWNTSDERQHEK